MDNITSNKIGKSLEINLFDEDYPYLLKQIYDPPERIYYKGNKKLLNTLCIAIVGSRKNTKYGKGVCYDIVKDLSNYKVAIVSGMALGIDRAAHYAALEYNVPTIAVLGSGIDYVYPKENYELYTNLVKSNLVISEYPSVTHPTQFTFPKRNRIISGLSIGIIVVEAGFRSGALITAHFALDQGREVFAVPGSILSETSVGTNQLIKNGEAKLYDSIKDLLEEIDLKQIKGTLGQV